MVSQFIAEAGVALLKVTAILIKQYNSVALLILRPQLLQMHSDNIWLLSNVNPIEKQQSFNTAPGLSYLADFVNNFLKDTLVPDEFTNAKPQNLKQ